MNFFAFEDENFNKSIIAKYTVLEMKIRIY